MTIDRRSILSALAGIGAAAPINSPRELLAKVDGDVGVFADLEAVPTGAYHANDDVWRAIERARYEYDRSAYHEGRLPVHIRTMKSWSPAYKHHWYREEMRAFERLMRSASDEQTMPLIARLLGLGGG